MPFQAEQAPDRQFKNLMARGLFYGIMRKEIPSIFLYGEEKL